MARTSSKTRKSADMAELTLHDLLIQKLQVLYDVEQEILKALPKMAKKADDAPLRDAFEKHLRETEQHVSRLEQAFSILGTSPKKMKSAGIRGIIEDGTWVMQNIKGPAALDANLIAAAQYVEHYEIAGYGSAHAWALELDQDEVADLLQQTLDEEKATDETLDDLATSGINASANPESEKDDTQDKESGTIGGRLSNLLSGQSSEDND
jgi:ferritin-like metal-binding protein YciE